ncbi:hypothetical protein CHUAL_002431 [Chamberlinius hualienensis]
MDTEHSADHYNDLLPVYYRRLFPFQLFHRWLSYGNVRNFYFSNREFSLTLDNDVYIRYRSYANSLEMTKEIVDKCPNKIDIGAVFNSKPKDHNTVSAFKPVEKELVFDIDMTDYDEIRYCCSGTDICPKCWTFMTIAVEIIDRALRDDFGFRHILWVYSGRRGIHCWVCDDAARQLTVRGRSSIANYLTITLGSSTSRKKINFYELNHPAIQRASRIIDKYFTNLHITDQDFLQNKIRWSKVIGLIPDEEVRNKLEKEMEKCNDSAERWEAILNKLESNISLANGLTTTNIINGIKLYLCYPRLDINVTKGLNHLLKSPFCVHPKSGRICVPVDPQNLSTFNPFTVPTINQLITEINVYDATLHETIMETDCAEKKKIKDYKKTSLNQSIEIFKDFIKNMEKGNSGKLLAKSDESCEF